MLSGPMDIWIRLPDSVILLIFKYLKAEVIFFRCMYLGSFQLFICYKSSIIGVTHCPMCEPVMVPSGTRRAAVESHVQTRLEHQSKTWNSPW